MDPTAPTPSTTPAEEAEAIRVGKIVIYPDRYEVYVDRRRVELTLTQFHLLFAMAHRPGWIISPDQFQRRLSHPRRQHAAAGASIKHHIAALRRKLGPGAVQVQTVRGQGYRLSEIHAHPVEPDPAG
ncbi:MAG: winged helix-turn-helix domain-containing protein [Planctomycetota bacterium]